MGHPVYAAKEIILGEKIISCTIQQASESETQKKAFVNLSFIIWLYLAP